MRDGWQRDRKFGVINGELAARAWLEALPELDDAAQARLALLIELLHHENARQNLVSMSSLGHVWQRHIVDSAQLLQHVPRETMGSWLDLGTGAGFPGLVIAILRPDASMLMVESRPKRAAWLNHAKTTLGLARAQVVASRLELLPSRPHSVISARAFAPLDRLLDLSARFSTDQTLWLLPKGRSAAHELQALTGWQHRFHVEQSLTDAEAGVVVGRLIGKTRQSG